MWDVRKFKSHSVSCQYRFVLQSLFHVHKKLLICSKLLVLWAWILIIWAKVVFISPPIIVFIRIICIGKWIFGAVLVFYFAADLYTQPAQPILSGYVCISDNSVSTIHIE